MNGFLTIEYNEQVVDIRYFQGKRRMNEGIIIWKKRYSHLFFNAKVYITLKSKMNNINYDR